MMIRVVSAVMGLAVLGGCGGSGGAANDSEPDNSVVENVAIAADWPASLNVFGDGYPKAGDPCRRVGESEATSNYLDDSADLVGCMSADAAKALGGKVVAIVDGVTLVSVPRGAAGPASDEGGDALVAGTDYNATSSIQCGSSGKLDATCSAGVKRRALDDGTTIVEVKKADGATRAIFFQGTKATGADSAQADGSAGYSFKASRDDDWTVIEFGPERYRIPDALVVGG